MIKNYEATITSNEVAIESLNSNLGRLHLDLDGKESKEVLVRETENIPLSIKEFADNLEKALQEIKKLDEFVNLVSVESQILTFSEKSQLNHLFVTAEENALMLGIKELHAEVIVQQINKLHEEIHKLHEEIKTFSEEEVDDKLGTTCFCVMFGPYLMLATDGLAMFVSRKGKRKGISNFDCVKHYEIIKDMIYAVCCGLDGEAEALLGLTTLYATIMIKEREKEKEGTADFVFEVASRLASMLNYSTLIMGYTWRNSFIIGGFDKNGKDMYCVEKKRGDRKYHCERVDQMGESIGTGYRFVYEYLDREGEGYLPYLQGENRYENSEYLEKGKNYCFDAVRSAVVKGGDFHLLSLGGVGVAPVAYKRCPIDPNDQHSIYGEWIEDSFRPHIVSYDRLTELLKEEVIDSILIASMNSPDV